MTLQARVGNLVPASGTRASLVPQTLSMRLWGLDWRAHLPWQFDGATLEVGTFADAVPFMEEHYPRIFGVELDRFFFEGMTEAKRRFGDEQDVFVFRAPPLEGEVQGKTVGVATAHPCDWSTYYIRTFAVLPEFRERRWVSEWARRIQEPLKQAGCNRWEGECSPANTPMMRMLLSQGCLITGTLNSERWGQMMRFAKFLNEEAESAYRRQYVYVPAFGRNAQPKERRPQ